MKELLTQDERYEVFREVQREFWIMDAFWQIEMFCDWHELGEEIESGWDAEELVDIFEKAWDMDTAENDAWNYALYEYARRHDIDTRRSVVFDF